MIVAFLGPRRLKITKEVETRLIDTIAKLVVNDGAYVFLFTNEGRFDYACWEIVTSLQVLYPNIRRIYARKEDKDDVKYLQGICYEDAFLLDAVRDAGILAESVRDDAMIGMCDILVTYFDTENLRMPRIKSDVETAVDCARKYNKRVINIWKK